MAKLYELTSDFKMLFDSLDNMTEDPDLTENQRHDLETAWFDTLESIEADFENKAENVAVYIKCLIAESEALKAEEVALKARRQQKEKRVEGLKKYLINNMVAIDLKKIDRPMAKLTVKNNPESAVFADEKAFISWAKDNNDDLLRYKEPEIAKTEVKKYLQSGGELPGVTLGRTQSIIIK